MKIACLKCSGALAALLGLTASASVSADDEGFSVLHTFEVADAVTGASATGSQPDTRPVIGAGHVIYGMSFTGGANGNGVVYRYDQKTGAYSVLHTFGALDANGFNEDGAAPGVALTSGPGNVFYGMASNGGAMGDGTIFQITASGQFTVLHTFSALDSNGHNEDGAAPLRSIVVAGNGDLYGTTRVGGENSCGPVGCGVVWKINHSGRGFVVVHQFAAVEGHAASLLQAHDGLLYGCAVWPTGAAGSGILYRMAPSGHDFQVLYRFSAVDPTTLANADGANCYEPLVETQPGVLYGAAAYGGANANGVIFRYSVKQPNAVQVVHVFGATNAAGENADGAFPYARLTVGPEAAMYSTASFGGANGNGVVYRIRPDGDFKVLHTFGAVDPATGGNSDGVDPDFGVVLDGEDSLIGMADYGGNGSTAGATGNGTLFRVELDR